MPESFEVIPIDFVDPATFGDEQLAASRMRDDATRGRVAKTGRDSTVRHREAGAVEREPQYIVAESLRDEQLTGFKRHKMRNAEAARAHRGAECRQPAGVGEAGDRSEVARGRSAPVHDEHLARIAKCK